MNKPLSMIVKETKSHLATVCNESGLSPILLDMILQGIYSEVHTLAEKQMSVEEKEYLKNLNNKN